MKLGATTEATAAIHVSMGGCANVGANMMSGIALTIVAVLLWERLEAMGAGVSIAAVNVPCTVYRNGPVSRPRSWAVSCVQCLMSPQQKKP